MNCIDLNDAMFRIHFHHANSISLWTLWENSSKFCFHSVNCGRSDTLYAESFEMKCLHRHWEMSNIFLRNNYHQKLPSTCHSMHRTFTFHILKAKRMLSVSMKDSQHLLMFFSKHPLKQCKKINCFTTMSYKILFHCCV